MVGRPVEVDSDQIETLIERNQCYTTWEVADILKTTQLENIMGEKKSLLFYRKKLNRLFDKPNRCNFQRKL